MSTHPSAERAIDRVSDLLNRQIGLRSEPALRGRLERCIRDDASAGGLDVDAYADTLMGAGFAPQNLVNRVTVQETSFFRHPEHFTLLASDLLRGLAQPVTIWSAACSNGQEAYSLAMLLEELDINGTIIASDISTAALERTAAARYTERELIGLSPQRIARYLNRSAESYQIKPNVRARVTPLQFNLLDPIPSQVEACQVILCRNVLIYFSPAHARAFLDRVSSALPEATLLLGAAESIWQLTDRYDTVRTGDTFSYRRRPAAIPADDYRSGIPKRRSALLRSATTERADPTAGPNGASTARGVTDLARAGARHRPTRDEPTAATDDHASTAAALNLAGQRATTAGDVTAAVVAFRKCAYLAPHDPMAHLNFGLALETAGDQPSAQRAYAAARNALRHTDGAHVEQATEGYTTEDLLRFIHHKQQTGKP